MSAKPVDEYDGENARLDDQWHARWIRLRQRGAGSSALSVTQLAPARPLTLGDVSELWLADFRSGVVLSFERI